MDAPWILLWRREHALWRQQERAAVALEGFKGGRDAQHADGEQSQARVSRYVKLLQRGKLAQGWGFSPISIPVGATFFRNLFFVLTLGPHILYGCD